MPIPAQTKPALLGAAAGALALAIIGFSWGGWVTGSAAAEAANKQADSAVVTAMAPVCAAAFKQDPKAAANLDKLKGLPSYSRHAFITEGGWATMPGSGRKSDDLARACANMLTT